MGASCSSAIWRENTRVDGSCAGPVEVVAMAAFPPAPRVLVVSASIGEGHDLPARFIVEGLRARRPEVVAPIVDGLRACGPLVERIIMGGSAFHSRLGNVLYDA